MSRGYNLLYDIKILVFNSDERESGEVESEMVVEGARGGGPSALWDTDGLERVT